jgi:hypothetical protein
MFSIAFVFANDKIIVYLPEPIKYKRLIETANKPTKQKIEVTHQQQSRKRDEIRWLGHKQTAPSYGKGLM